MLEQDKRITKVKGCVTSKATRFPTTTCKMELGNKESTRGGRILHLTYYRSPADNFDDVTKAKSLQRCRNARRYVVASSRKIQPVNF